MSRRSSNDGPPPVVAVLGYHRIGPPGPGAWETWFYVPEAIFARHLATVREAGWVPIDHGALLAGLADPATLPPRGVLVTFDDGLRSVREVALPWLRRFECPAVAFVPTDFIGQASTFDAQEPVERLLDWDDLRLLQQGGVSVQSHGAAHRAFSWLGPGAQDDELRRSRATLEEGLGTRVELFAYPYGDAGPDPEAMATRLTGAGYRAAFGYGGGPFSPPADPWRLPRLAIGPDTDLAAALELGAAVR
jgi:peptidoglycan/xylan/chitin deacetylase (PgdA/CDA1 family)